MKKNTSPKSRTDKHQFVAKKQQNLKPSFDFKSTILLLAGLAIIALIGFFPCVNNGFTNWDDPTLIVDNLLIRHFNFESINNIFTKPYFSNYQPLHIFSYLIEYQLWGLNASGYHWVSVVQHIINVALVWMIAKKLSNNIIISTLTALFFAITPMRVESVAWAAERKDMLYSMFFFSAWICYISYLQFKITDADGKQTFKIKYLVFTFLFFVLSVFSKTMAVSLIPVLVFTDIYLNRKIDRRAILEKIPFVVLAIVMGLISVTLAKEGGSVDTDENYKQWHRVLFACRNLLMYATKLIFPFNLSGYYQYPEMENGIPPNIFFISAGLVLILAALVIWSFKKNKLVFFSAAYFVSTVALVLMIFPVGPTLFSERYSYVPSVMLYFLIFTTLIQFVQKKYPGNTSLIYMIIGVCCIYASYFTYLTRQRCEVWKDNLAFWTDVIENDPKVPIAFNNRANEYKINGDFPRAIDDYMMALKLKQDYLEPNASLGDVYRQLGKNDSALFYLKNALQMKPDYPQALINRGIVMAVSNQLDSSMSDFNRAIQLNPNMLEAFSNRGNLFCMRGDFDSGYKDYTRVIEINPDFKDAYINRGRVLFQKQKYDESIADFNTYFQKGGKDADALLMIARCYAEKKDLKQAIDFAEQAQQNGHQQAAMYLQMWKQPPVSN